MKIIKRTDKLGFALAPKQLVENKLRVRYMYREKSDNQSDSGWRFFSGFETDEYVNNPDNIGLYDVNTISSIDPDIVPFLSSPVGSAFERDSTEQPFVRSITEWGGILYVA